MLFNSTQFIFVFLPVALIGFHILSRASHRFAALWLVLASLAFYAYWRISFLPLLLISIAFNYTVARLIFAAAGRPRLQSVLLTAGIALDLGALVWFKYLFAFFSFLRIHGVADIPFRDVILPLGISFFTFTQIGYLVDVRQGVAKDRNLLNYLIFVTFFPHLIAGPILHNREMMPQFADPNTYKFSNTNLAVGLTIFIIGLLKKTVLADPLSATVAAGFASGHTIGMADAWITVAAYSLQLYFDFSGYSDMAIGLARLFNIRFPLNFNSPYKATTVIDYWQRFHMTLTRFITMYIFNPLAMAATRRRVAKGRDISKKALATPRGFVEMVGAPTMATMGLAGIWHGAGLQFLIFGLLHGLYIATNHAVRVFFPPANRQAQPQAESGISRVWKVMAVYVAALLAFAFFRASSTGNALDVVGAMAGGHGLQDVKFIELLPRLALLYVIVWAFPNTQQIMTNFEPALGKMPAGVPPALRWTPNFVWAAIVGIGIAISVVAIDRPGDFLYFQF